MTSNIGTHNINSSQIGFSKSKDDDSQNQTGEIMKEVKKYFIPEFLNRIDDIIVFNSLSIENLSDIIELQLKDLHANLKNMNTKLKVTKTAKDILIQDGSHREWGARPLRREIQNEIENVISSKFLNGEFVENGVITVKGKLGKLDFTQKLLKSISKRAEKVT